MNNQKSDTTNYAVSDRKAFKNFPTLSIKYGSPYGNRRTDEENRLVLQMDRLLSMICEN